MIADLERDIPSNWLTTSTRFLFHVLNGSTPASNEASFWNGDIFWATPEDIGSLQGKVLNDTRRKITKDGYENSGAQIAPVGSILLTTRAPVGNLALTGIPLCTNQGCRLLVPKSDHVDTNFFYYQLQARRSELESYAAGTTFQELSATQLKAFQLWLPPLAEQQTIGKYLDRETSKIDTLIAELDDLLKLVAEKRRTTISHAVTRGINPGVPLVDSGVEWIGEIPEHWEIKRLKHISPRISVGLVINPSSYVEENGTVPIIVGSNISEGSISVLQARMISEESNQKLAQSRLYAGDLVTIRVGYPGVTAVIPPELDGINCASVMITRSGESFNSHWLCYAFNSYIGRANIGLVEYGAAQKQFNISHAVEFLFPVPTREEQEEIVAYLDYRTAKLESLTKTIQETIELLQERRSALIAAAVTGKIRVTE